MADIHVLPRAALRIEEIHEYSRDAWGEDQANRYVKGMLLAIQRLVHQTTSSRPIAAGLGLSGYYFRYERHFIYWRHKANGDISIVTILHQSMNQNTRLREEFRV